MEGCPSCAEVQGALKTLVQVFKSNSKNGKLTDGDLKKKMEEKKSCPKVQAKMAECKAKMGPNWKCEEEDDFKKFCWFVCLELEETFESPQ